MSLSEMIDGFASALAETKNKLAQVQGEIAIAKGERNKIEWASPHTDDIVAAFERGLSHAQQSFETRMQWYLGSACRDVQDAAGMVGRAPASLLMVGGKPPESGVQSVLPWMGLGEHQKEIDVAAVTYFLSPVIRANLPELVERIYPHAKRGLKQSERTAKLHEIDRKLIKLEAEAERLKNEINAAVGAVRPAN